jgi:hypothetical protein
VIKWAHNFYVLAILEWRSEVTGPEAWVDTTVNKSAAKASAKSLHGVS